MWTGYPELLDWWQSLTHDAALAVVEDEDSYTNKVLELEEAESKVRVLSVMKTFDTSSGAWTIELATGETREVKLHTNEYVDIDYPSLAGWTLSTVYTPLTDAMIDWSLSADLSLLHVDYDGDTYPTFLQAKHVAMALQEQQVFSVETQTETVDTVSRICAFLTQYKPNTYMMLRNLAESLRDLWLEGSAIRDAFTVLMSIEAKVLRSLTGHQQANTMSSLLNACTPSTIQS
jgi:hypothetical protein